MRCADDAGLWAYAEGELLPDAGFRLEAHLATCDRCRDALARIGTTRAVLRGATPSRPEVKWGEVDEAVMSAATARFAQAQRSSPWWALAGVAATAALALVLWMPMPGRPPVPAPPVVPAIASAADVQIESARGARVTEAASAEQVLEQGIAIHEGARIRTDENGSALLRLPEESRARLGPRTDAVLTQVRADAVDIQLHQGAVVVEASHAARERFVVDALEAQIRVVGTVFRVSRHEGQVVVAVSEGRVLVESRGGGQSRLIDAGQRLVVGPGGAVLEQRALADEDQAAFAQLAPEPVPVAAVEPGPPAPPVPTRRKPVETARNAAPVATEPVGLSPPPPAAAAPGIPMSELAVPDFGARVPQRAARGELPTTAEALFLRRAEEALRTGRCGSYLLGLVDITETSEDRNSRELARILRARCFDDRLEPIKAEAEYRKYLDRHPRGRFADEARRALER